MVALMNTVLLHALTAAHGLRARLSEERGQDLIEYALWSGVIAIGLILVGSALYLGVGNTLGGAIKDCVDFDTLTGCGPLG